MSDRYPTAKPSIPINSAPPEFSMNDVMNLRAQDQEIALRVAQLLDMSASPWEKVECLKEEISSPAAGLAVLSGALSKLMNPISVAGSQRAVTGKGTSYYLNIGSRKVWFADERTQETTHKKLNLGYFDIIHKQRLWILDEIAQLAESGHTLSSDLKWQRCKCGQTEVVFLPHQEKIFDDLNRLWFDSVKDEQARIRGIIKRLALDRSITLRSNDG